jgi:hypothetical protein
MWDSSGPKSAVLAVALLASWTAAVGATGAIDRLGNHHESPVYYELAPTPAHLVENRELLHQNKLKLRGFPVVDVSDWNWKDGEIDNLSWWIQAEELRFLLPLIRSDRSEDRRLARKWFLSWYETYQQDSGDFNKARWREPMSAAYRGMVLVYFLKTEETRADGDEDVIGKLRETIHAHQEFLAQPKYFDSNSNHGLVEAFGLLEVTRVFPDSERENLALDRMLEISDRSVSELGTHMEHSPAYHFVFLSWLDSYTTYIKGLRHLDGNRVSRLFDYVARMRETAYYMHDRDGTIPEIGDTDSMSVYDRFPGYGDTDAGREPRAFYDPEAGYAIYASPRRYVMFTIQNQAPELRYHFHDDVLAVYYRHRGETILGDSGKYEYTRSPLRTFFVSMYAHNSVFPPRPMGMRIELASSAGFEETEDTTRFKAVVNHRGQFVVTRTVTIPRGSDALIVEDDFAKSLPPGVPRPHKAINEKGARRPTKWRKRGTIIWNFGYDIESVVPEARSEVPSRTTSYRLTTYGGRQLRFSIETTGAQPPEFVAHVVRGQVEPRRGWYSPSLFVMRPCYTLETILQIDGPFTMVTRVDPISKKYFPGLRILRKGY